MPLFRAVMLCLAAFLAGCPSPESRIDRIATEQQLEKQQLIGSGFAHVAYFSRGRKAMPTLHVYLSGDGSPWIGKTRISTDPTPRNPISLQLMGMDPNPSLYLGRPCYHGLANNTGCDASKWTSGRYSEQVVVSMTEALRTFVHDNGYKDVVLIGYSGGGVLAWLIAERLDNTQALITIAANLDIDAWARLHGYTPLHHSLNPVARGPLPPQIHQLHLVGERDTNVPPSLVHTALGSIEGRIEDDIDRGAIVVAKPADHRCCWERLWPEILEDIRRMSRLLRE